MMEWTFCVQYKPSQDQLGLDALWECRMKQHMHEALPALDHDRQKAEREEYFTDKLFHGRKPNERRPGPPTPEVLFSSTQTNGTTIEYLRTRETALIRTVRLDRPGLKTRRFHHRTRSCEAIMKRHHCHGTGSDARGVLYESYRPEVERIPEQF